MRGAFFGSLPPEGLFFVLNSSCSRPFSLAACRGAFVVRLPAPHFPPRLDCETLGGSFAPSASLPFSTSFFASTLSYSPRFPFYVFRFLLYIVFVHESETGGQRFIVGLGPDIRILAPWFLLFFL